MNITQLLAWCAKQEASDLHLSAGLPPLLRLNGQLLPSELPAMTSNEVLAAVTSLMNEHQKQTFEQELEVDFAFQAPSQDRFRINAFNHLRGAGAVLRRIPAKVLSLEELGLGEVFRRLALMPNGLVLVTGPTGSGKSTTLAAMLNYINEQKNGHLLTLEDPIEFLHPSKKCLVNQREVQQHTLGFAPALRSALRQDPDVLLVGELRDLETIRLALTAAETGHTVFATLHTSGAAKSINRLVDVFPSEEQALVRSLLAESLQGVVSQLLVNKPAGGRLAVHEILIGTPAVRNLIRENKPAQLYSAMQTGASFGMQTLDQHLQQLVSQQLISPEAAKEVARQPELF